MIYQPNFKTLNYPSLSGDVACMSKLHRLLGLISTTCKVTFKPRTTHKTINIRICTCTCICVRSCVFEKQTHIYMYVYTCIHRGVYTCTCTSWSAGCCSASSHLQLSPIPAGEWPPECSAAGGGALCLPAPPHPPAWREPCWVFHWGWSWSGQRQAGVCPAGLYTWCVVHVWNMPWYIYRLCRVQMHMCSTCICTCVYVHIHIYMCTCSEWVTICT